MATLEGGWEGAVLIQAGIIQKLLLNYFKIVDLDKLVLTRIANYREGRTPVSIMQTTQRGTPFQQRAWI